MRLKDTFVSRKKENFIELISLPKVSVDAPRRSQMFVAVILCMLISLFALLITVGCILARTGFAKWWGSLTMVAWAVTAGAVVLTLSSRAAPAPVDSAAPPLPASSSSSSVSPDTAASTSTVSSDTAASTSTVSSAAPGSMDDVQTGQLLASILQQLKNGQSIGDEYLNQLPAEKRVQVRAAVSAP
ncbi:MAG: hypothetical protein JWN30_1049 [Bacilli bacterium]|nr:hypothetical protein [Bacilli bacterium]